MWEQEHILAWLHLWRGTHHLHFHWLILRSCHHASIWPFLPSWEGYRFGEVCSTGKRLCRKPWWGWQRGCTDPYFVPYISLGTVLQWISCLLSLCSGENHIGFLVLSHEEVGYATCSRWPCRASYLQYWKGRSIGSCFSWICHLCLCTESDGLFWHLSDLGINSHPPSTSKGTQVNFCIRVRPSALKTSGGMPLGPADLPHCNSSVASLTSSIVGGPWIPCVVIFLGSLW